MGLLPLVIRLALWRALFEKTAAGKNVFDSAIGAIDFKKAGKNVLPVLTIVTDEQKINGWDLHLPHGHTNATREIDVVIEIGVAAEVTVEMQDGTTTSAVTIPPTDWGLERSVDLISRQIMRVLQVNDPEDPWPNLYRRLAGRTKDATSKRGAGAEDKERFAARQIVLTVEPSLDEPAFGELPGEGTLWHDLLTAMDADSIFGQAKIAGIIRKAIVGDEIPDWARMQADLGATVEALVAMGLNQLADSEAVVTVTRITSDGDHLESVVEGEP